MSQRRPYLVPLLVVGGIFAGFSLLFFGIAMLFGSTVPLAGGERIGVVEVVGPIIGSERTVQALVDFRQDDSIKGVVLRVDSPGGGVGPSQEIYSEVKKLAAVKPVVVSMGAVAASGGYYVSLPAQKIVANPGTLTGSIGVIMGFTNYQDLLEKVGLKSNVIKSGEHKDIGSPVRPMTDEDRAILQGLIDDVYQQFVTDVASGRHLDPDKAARLADGRVYTGRQALEAGLIDQLGNFRDAIDVAAGLAEMEGEPVLVYPPEPRRNIFAYFFEQAAGEFREGLSERTQSGLQYRWNADGR